jgi:hypothetical protein
MFDFAETRGGRHAGQFLGKWRGTLVCDDYSGYKALFRLGITEAGLVIFAACTARLMARWIVCGVDDYDAYNGIDSRIVMPSSGLLAVEKIPPSATIRSSIPINPNAFAFLRQLG